MRHPSSSALLVCLVIVASGCGNTITRDGETYRAEDAGAILLEPGRLRVFASADPVELAIDDEFTFNVELTAPDFLTLVDGADHPIGDGAAVTVDRWQVFSFALACETPESASGEGTLRLDRNGDDGDGAGALRAVHLVGRFTRPEGGPCADEAPVELDVDAPVEAPPPST